MKKKDFMKEIVGLDRASLEKRATQYAEELMRLRFKKKARQLEKSHQIAQTKKLLARVSTLLSKASATSEK